jgi:carboxyl-terminal processing protease
MEAPRKRNLRFLKWSAVSLFAALFVSAGISFGRFYAFQNLPARERHLGIYDEFCRQIRRHYFDPTFAGIDWKQIDEQWREKAATAASDLELYSNVLANIALWFPMSHILALPPPPRTSLAPNGRTAELVDLVVGGPGFDWARLHRGTRAGAIVADVVSGSPADRAGIQPGWVMLTNTITTSSTAHFAGEFVRLAPDQALQYEINLDLPTAAAADIVKIEYDLEPLTVRGSFESRRMTEGSCFIRFDTFADGKIIDQVLAALDQCGPQGVVIDLRNNPGGELQQLRRFLDRVLKNDSPTGAELSHDGRTEWHTSYFTRPYSGAVAVLIGPMTASAGEIFAAAIQDNARGQLIGRTTNGSVMYSKRYVLPDGGQVQVPIGDFLRVGNRRIEGVGVEPDLRVLPTRADISAGRDVALERAVATLNDGKRRAEQP